MFKALVLAMLFSLHVNAATTCTTYTGTGSSAVGLAANKNRLDLTVQNTSGSALTVYMTFGAALATAEYISLAQGVIWQPNLSVPTDAVYIKAASGSPTVTFCETVKSL